MSHPVPGQSYYCEDCHELLDDGGHKCKLFTNII